MAPLRLLWCIFVLSSKRPMYETETRGKVEGQLNSILAFEVFHVVFARRSIYAKRIK